MSSTTRAAPRGRTLLINSEHGDARSSARVSCDARPCWSSWCPRLARGQLRSSLRLCLPCSPLPADAGMPPRAEQREQTIGYHRNGSHCQSNTTHRHENARPGRTSAAIGAPADFMPVTSVCGKKQPARIGEGTLARRRGAATPPAAGPRRRRRCPPRHARGPASSAWPPR